MAREVKQVNKLTSLSKGWNAVFVIILFFISVLVIIPMLLVLVVSFSSEISIADNGYTFFPSEWTLDGYKYLFKQEINY